MLVARRDGTTRAVFTDFGIQKVPSSMMWRFASSSYQGIVGAGAPAAGAGAPAGAPAACAPEPAGASDPAFVGDGEVAEPAGGAGCETTGGAFGELGCEGCEGCASANGEPKIANATAIVKTAVPPTVSK